MIYVATKDGREKAALTKSHSSHYMFNTFKNMFEETKITIKNLEINEERPSQKEVTIEFTEQALNVSNDAVVATPEPTPEPVEPTVQPIVNKWGLQLSDEEKDLLARIVWLESRGETDLGELAVIEVVFNRMLLYNESLYDVLSKSKQFTSWKKRGRASPENRELYNIEKVLNGETDILDFNTIYFGTSPYNKKLHSKIGRHYFCNK